MFVSMLYLRMVTDVYTADYVSVHIFVSLEFGAHIGTLVDNGTRVFMHISIGRHHTTYYSTINKTSMLFLSISFIVLMIISLAWLVFYYVQRSRYTYAKQRLSVVEQVPVAFIQLEILHF